MLEDIIIKYYNHDERFFVLNEILSVVKGNIIEIGAGYGNSTCQFCNIAKKWNRKVLVIDPFENGWKNMPQSYQYKYDIFQQNTKEYDNLIVHKDYSNSNTVPHFINQHTPISFAFVDGLQFKENILSDLNLLSDFDTTVICIDDICSLTGFKEVPVALPIFLEQNKKYKRIKFEKEKQEGYLIKI